VSNGRSRLKAEPERLAKILLVLAPLGYNANICWIPTELVFISALSGYNVSLRITEFRIDPKVSNRCGVGRRGKQHEA
jgi:hypothetical protein